ncbi:hypothetical protein ACXYTP_23910 [Tsukamurella ocularis]
MSAVESRLAATLAKHPLYADDDGDVCKCGWEPDYEQIDHSAMPAYELVTMQHSAHVAAVITSSDDLAVIELPEPNKSGFVWVNGHGEVELLDYRRFLPDEAVQLAASILAAAKAAEAVSDRER